MIGAMTSSDLSAILVAVLTCLGTIGGVIGKRKLDGIHALVNSRLTYTLQDISALAQWITANARPGDPPPPRLVSETQTPQPETPTLHTAPAPTDPPPA